MIGSPHLVQVDWFRAWVGLDGWLPPGHPRAVALLHPGTRRSVEHGRPPYVGPREGWPGEEQQVALSGLLLTTTDPAAPATLASYDGVPDVPVAPPLDVAVRVSSIVDFLVVSGRLEELVPNAWSARVGPSQPVSALWPDDRTWCLYGDPDLAFTVLAGPAALCERALTAPDLAAAPWPDPVGGPGAVEDVSV